MNVPGSPDLFPIGFRLRPSTFVDASVLGSDGKFVTAVPVPGAASADLSTLLATPDGLVMTLQRQPDGGGEFWTDVSVLHARADQGKDRFDFGWLFSDATEVDPTIATRVSAFSGMTEAQARLIAVSPPIPII
jgi:hypothetical protein